MVDILIAHLPELAGVVLVGLADLARQHLTQRRTKQRQAARNDDLVDALQRLIDEHRRRRDA